MKCLTKKKDLYHVCQLSKLYHSIAEPLLYQHVSLSGCQVRLIKPLLAHLLERPDLAARIKTFQVYPHPFWYHSHTHDPRSELVHTQQSLALHAFGEKLTMALKAKVQGTFHDKRTIYHRILSRGQGYDAAITVILALSDNVENVYLCDQWNRSIRPLFWYPNAGHLLSKVPARKKLKHLTLDKLGYHKALLLEALGSVAMNNVEELHVRVDTDECRPASWIHDVVDRLPHLSSLKVSWPTGCFHEYMPTGLGPAAELMFPFKHLKTLDIHYSVFPQSVVFCSVITSLPSCLETLHLREVTQPVWDCELFFYKGDTMSFDFDKYISRADLGCITKVKMYICAICQIVNYGLDAERAYPSQIHVEDALMLRHFVRDMHKQGADVEVWYSACCLGGYERQIMGPNFEGTLRFDGLTQSVFSLEY